MLEVQKGCNGVVDTCIGIISDSSKQSPNQIAKDSDNCYLYALLKIYYSSVKSEQLGMHVFLISVLAIYCTF